jgi:hypothetical protein
VKNRLFTHIHHCVKILVKTYKVTTQNRQLHGVSVAHPLMWRGLVLLVVPLSMDLHVPRLETRNQTVLAFPIECEHTSPSNYIAQQQFWHFCSTEPKCCLLKLQLICATTLSENKLICSVNHFFKYSANVYNHTCTTTHPYKHMHILIHIWAHISMKKLCTLYPYEHIWKIGLTWSLYS